MEAQFSLRVVTLDHYMCPLDTVESMRNDYEDLAHPTSSQASSSSFGSQPSNSQTHSSPKDRRNRVSEIKVPVVRIYGATPRGQHACIHVHGSLPYLYILPCGDRTKFTLGEIQSGRQFKKKIKQEINSALDMASVEQSVPTFVGKVAGARASTGGYRRGVNRKRRIAKMEWVKGMQFYGFHDKEDTFLKISVYNPGDILRVAQALRTGLVSTNDKEKPRTFDVFESHVPYLMQVIMDYSLYGSGFAHFSSVKFRAPLPSLESLSKYGAIDCSDTASSSSPSQNKTICWKIWHSRNADNVFGTCRNVVAPDFSDWPNLAEDRNEESSSLFSNNSSTTPRNPFGGRHRGNFVDGPWWPKRQTTCMLELDASVSEILNRRLELLRQEDAQSQKYKMERIPSLRALWTEARRRKRVSVVGANADNSAEQKSPNSETSTPSMPSTISREEMTPGESTMQVDMRKTLRKTIELMERAGGGAADHGGSGYNLELAQIAAGSCDALIPASRDVSESTQDMLAELWSDSSSSEDDEAERNVSPCGSEVFAKAVQLEDRKEERFFMLSQMQQIRDEELEEQQASDDEPIVGPDGRIIDPDLEMEEIFQKYRSEITQTGSVRGSFDEIGEDDVPRPTNNIFADPMVSPQSMSGTQLLEGTIYTPSPPSIAPAYRVERGSSSSSNDDVQIFTPSPIKLRKKRPREYDSPATAVDNHRAAGTAKVSIKMPPVPTFGAGSILTNFPSNMGTYKTKREGHIRGDKKTIPTMGAMMDMFSPSRRPPVSQNRKIVQSQRFPPAPISIERSDSYSQELEHVSPNAETPVEISIAKQIVAEVKGNTDLFLLEVSAPRDVQVWTLNRIPPTASVLINGDKSRKLRHKTKHVSNLPSPDSGVSSQSSSVGHRMNLVQQNPSLTSEKSEFSLDSGPQQMSWLALETFAISLREDRRLPDPSKDKVVMIVYTVECDNGRGVPGASYGTRRQGIIVVGENVAGDNLKSSINLGGLGIYPPTKRTGKNSKRLDVTIVSNERELLMGAVDLVHAVDPDILIGWDIERYSWGYLLARGRALGIKLERDFSRTPMSRTDHRHELNMTGKDPNAGIFIIGRITLSMWRLMHKEPTIKLKGYSIENVAWHLLRTRLPRHDHLVLVRWFRRHHLRSRTIRHIARKINVYLDIMYKLDLIGRTSEMARLIGIDFYSVLWRGSQFRVESVMLRITKPKNYVLYSPSKSDVASQRALEEQALTLEPESKFYEETPVVVLDFQSLYPSLMIAYNMCYSTCLGRMGGDGKVSKRLGAKRFYEPPVENGLRDFVNDPESHMARNGVMFVSSRNRRGILPDMLEELLNTRIMVKKELKTAKSKGEKILARILDARQYALKMISNVTYGYTSASFSGRMPCSDIADAIVITGRFRLFKAIQMVEEKPGEFADHVNRVVYGDTDSLFVQMKEGISVEKAFEVGSRISKCVSETNLQPMLLKLEKVYLPCVLQTKKRYVGWMYESPGDKPKLDDKGIETMRSDQCPVVADTLREALLVLFKTKQGGKNYANRAQERLRKNVLASMQRLLRGDLPLSRFIFFRKVRENYKVLPPHMVVAMTKMRSDPMARPINREFIPYVICCGTSLSNKHKIADLAVAPERVANDYSIRVNLAFYARQILQVLDRMFKLANDWDVHSWYNTMPRPVFRHRNAGAFAKEKNSSGKLITQFFQSTHCFLCGEVGASKHFLCSSCASNKPVARFHVEVKVTRCERKRAEAIHTCLNCQGHGRPDHGIACSSIDCPIYFSRHLALENCVESQGILDAMEDLFTEERDHGGKEGSSRNQGRLTSLDF